MNRVSLFLFAVGALLVAQTVFAQGVGISPGPGTRYATDAYPGFDTEEDLVSPSRKEPRWFGWINGPNRDNATDQLAYCRELLADGNYSKAVKHLDALVREWPTSSEAPVAQLLMADTLFDKLGDFEEAFRAYMYLVDFYSLHCDYAAMTAKMRESVRLMRVDGKRILFFRFANTVDVRRFYEACVLRAPGAEWAPAALLEIADLREEEGKYLQAIKVYENLINLHGDTPEAKIGILREANARMVVLREHAYNRDRCRDTIDFLRMSLKTCDVKDVDQIKDFLREAQDVLEEEAYRGACFYDSNTRTVRSAITAYERFLSDYPESKHAEQIRERVEQLKGLEK